MKKFLKNIISLCLALILIFVSCSFSNSVKAEEESPAKIYIEKKSVNAGEYFSLSLKALNLKDVAGLEVEIHYDEEAFIYNSRYFGSLVSDAVNTVNTDIKGTIKFNTISTVPFNGSGDLLNLDFTSQYNAKGNYIFDVAIGSAYDSKLNPVSIAGEQTRIEVKESQQSLDIVYFNWMSDKNEIKYGETFNLNLQTWSGYNFAAADFEFYYDSEIFEVLNAEFGSELKNANNAIYTINISTKGYIKASFAATSGINSALPALTIQFKLIKNITANSKIEAKITEIYNTKLNPLNYNCENFTVNTVFQEKEKEATVVSIPSMNGHGSLAVNVHIDNANGLSAGDFQINYDNYYLKCVKVEKTDENSMLFVNPKYESGIIKFSYINEKGLVENSNIVKLTFEIKNEGDSTINISGTNVVDQDFKRLNIEYKSGILEGTVHHYIYHEGKDATCTENGYKPYQTCELCDYTTYEEIPALGHKYSDPKYIWNEDNTKVTATRVCLNDSSHIETETVDVTYEVITKPICTEVGLGRYTSKTFNNSAFDIQTKDIELEALGHNFGDWIIDKEPVYDSDGLKHRVCLTCGFIEKASIPSLKHIFDTEYTIDKEPTCTEPGEKSIHCQECDLRINITVIPALGHDFGEVVYKWNEDNTKITATRVCNRDPNHIETETVGIRQDVIVKNPTCSNLGIKRYELEAFKNSAFDKQFIDVEIEALGHNYDDPIYQWNEDHTKLTATRVCKRDPSHIETETVDVTYEVVIKPTCVKVGLGRYTSEAFTNSVFEVQTYEQEIPMLEHNATWVVIEEATTEKEGLEGLKCSVCGKILETRAISKLDKPFPIIPVSIGSGITAILIIGAIIFIIKKRKM